MTTLLLRLGAPLQSWGTSSRFVRRNTDRVPSRSGVIGLLAAAQGVRRTDPLEELLSLRIGVRIDQPGQLERDFQTARSLDGSTTMPLSYRFYLADAVFTVALEGDPDLLRGLEQALRSPVFPLYLGRRSCPPAGQLLHGLREGTVRERLETEPWHASPWTQRRHCSPTVGLDIVVDCPADAADAELVRDEPVSFDPRNRAYGWRTVHRDQVEVPNPSYQPTAPPADPFDPMAAFEEIA
ncbi:type I-E CRISPR-associated protein Cas5/CasD [Saccharothrix australiensis]|uniref:CRISPR-associated Cas5e family protein n=1 Tax=Saccharothrix australiensis TaxID=2072 RepID=A0A495W0D1_9PSEU|nr:type I-E CRISPR-associated protein Cas5/CasD [Saccharothrix australiensis]RKT54135.1 CRISPR-associated Cas5e family protein [Saccharothrix australiensis]